MYHYYYLNIIKPILFFFLFLNEQYNKKYQRNGLQDSFTEDLSMAIHIVLGHHNHLRTRLLEVLVSPPHHLLHALACR